MQIDPITDCRREGEPWRASMLVIECYVPEKGYSPISHSRMMDVGVGGKYMRDPFNVGGPCRKATLSELRRIDRHAIADMRQRYPTCEIRVRRAWFS